jgi:hypothetical protein
MVATGVRKLALAGGVCQRQAESTRPELEVRTSIYPNMGDEVARGWCAQSCFSGMGPDASLESSGPDMREGCPGLDAADPIPHTESGAEKVSGAALQPARSCRARGKMIRTAHWKSPSASRSVPHQQAA